MNRVAVVILLPLVLAFTTCSVGEIKEKVGLNENGGHEEPLEPVELEADYALGVGWIPFPQTLEGQTWEKVNLRRSPTTEAPIIASVDKGTLLEIYGVSVACSLVMSQDEWEDYIVEKNRPIDDYEEGLLRLTRRKMAWYRVKYGSEFVWAHTAFVDTEAPDGIPGYTSIMAGSFGETLFFDRNGTLQKVFTYQEAADLYGKVIPFAEIKNPDPELSWGYLYLQYFGSNPGEPAYDLRHCTARAFKLHRDKELGKSVPRWFTALSDAGVVVSDFEDTDAGVWVADMAGAKVILVDANGKILNECELFALPRYLTGDGRGGVWVADPYVGRVVRLNRDGEPVGLIEGLATDAIVYNPVTEQLWIYGYIPDEDLSYRLFWGKASLSIYDEAGKRVANYDKYNALVYYEGSKRENFTEYYIGQYLKTALEVDSDGNVIMYCWVADGA